MILCPLCLHKHPLSAKCRRGSTQRFDGLFEYQFLVGQRIRALEAREAELLAVLKVAWEAMQERRNAIPLHHSILDKKARWDAEDARVRAAVENHA